MFMILGKLLLKKKLWLNLIVILQLAFVLTVANVLIGNFNKSHKNSELTKCYEDSTAFFSPMRIDGEAQIDIDYELLKKEGTQIEFLPNKIEGDQVQIFCYGTHTFQGLRSQLETGEWPIEQYSDGYVNCIVIGNKYSIGDIFAEEIDGRTVSFRVCGSVGEKATLISPSKSSYSMSADLLFFDYNASKSGSAIICSSDEIANPVKTRGNAMVFYTTENSVAHLQNTGKVFGMQQLRNNSNEELLWVIKSFLPLAVCFCLMGAVAVVGMACMNILANRQVFEVYFRCGMTKKDGFLLNLGYMCWMILGIAITTVVLFVLFALVGTVDSANYLVGINQFVFSIGYLTVIAVLTALISLPMLNYLDR